MLRVSYDYERVWVFFCIDFFLHFISILACHLLFRSHVILSKVRTNISCNYISSIAILIKPCDVELEKCFLNNYCFPFIYLWAYLVSFTWTFVYRSGWLFFDVWQTCSALGEASTSNDLVIVAHLDALQYLLNPLVTYWVPWTLLHTAVNVVSSVWLWLYNAIMFSASRRSTGVTIRSKGYIRVYVNVSASESLTTVTRITSTCVHAFEGVGRVISIS